MIYNGDVDGCVPYIGDEVPAFLMVFIFVPTLCVLVDHAGMDFQSGDPCSFPLETMDSGLTG